MLSGKWSNEKNLPTRVEEDLYVHAHYDLKLIPVSAQHFFFNAHESDVFASYICVLFSDHHQFYLIKSNVGRLDRKLSQLLQRVECVKYSTCRKKKLFDDSGVDSSATTLRSCFVDCQNNSNEDADAMSCDIWLKLLTICPPRNCEVPYDACVGVLRREPQEKYLGNVKLYRGTARVGCRISPHSSRMAWHFVDIFYLGQKSKSKNS